MKKEIAKIKKKNKKLPIFDVKSGIVTPIRMLGRYLQNKKLPAKEKAEINKLIMQVDNFKGDGDKRKMDAKVNSMMLRIKRKLDIKKENKKATGGKITTKKKKKQTWLVNYLKDSTFSTL